MSNPPPSDPPQGWGQPGSSGEPPEQPPGPPPGQGHGEPPGWGPPGQPQHPGPYGVPPPGEPGQGGGQPDQPGQQWGQPGQQWGPPGQQPPPWGPGGPGDPEGPQPSGDEPSAGGSKLPLIIGAAVALVVVIVVGLVIVLVSGGGGGSPQDTADAFIQAAEDGDCEKALSLISDDLKKSQGADCSDSAQLLPPEGSDIEFGDVKISDETDSSATATVDAKVSGQTLPLTLTLVNQDGDWKIDQIGG